MDIELKTPTENAINNFIGLILKYNRQDHTVIGIRGNQQTQLIQAYNDQVVNQP